MGQTLQFVAECMTLGQPILLLPGMGADARVFSRLRCKRRLLAIHWPVVAAGTSLREYAEAIIARWSINSGSIVGGVSMGAIVALEIARLARARMAVMISGCRRREQIAPWLRHLSPLARMVPFSSLSLCPELTGGTRRLVIDMARRTPPGFMRWGCREIMRWPGYPEGIVRTASMHGSRDVIMPPHRQNIDVVVAGAGHLLILTHPMQASHFLDGLPQ